MQNCQIIKCAVHFFNDFSEVYSGKNDPMYCKIKPIFDGNNYKEDLSSGFVVKIPQNINDGRVVDYKKKPTFYNQQKSIKVAFMPDRVVFLKAKQNERDDINDIKSFLKDIKEITTSLGEAYSFLGKRISLVVETLDDPKNTGFDVKSNVCSYYDDKTIKEYAEKIVTEYKIDDEVFNLSTSINKTKMKIAWETEPQIKIHGVFDFNSLSEKTANRFSLNEINYFLLELYNKYQEISNQINS